MPDYLSKIKKMFGAEALEEANDRKTTSAPATSDAVKRDTARRIKEAQSMSKKKQPYRHIKPKHI